MHCFVKKQSLWLSQTKENKPRGTRVSRFTLTPHRRPANWLCDSIAWMFLKLCDWKIKNGRKMWWKLRKYVGYCRLKFKFQSLACALTCLLLPDSLFLSLAWPKGGLSMRSDWLQVLTLPLQWHRPFLGNRDTSPHWTEPRSPQSDALRYCIPLKGWKKRRETVKPSHCWSNFALNRSHFTHQCNHKNCNLFLLWRS